MKQGTRTSPPPPLDPVPFHVPTAQRVTIDNGLRVVLFEDKRLPIVSYRLVFRFGDAHDPADSVGLTSAVASLLTEGTENYTSAALAEKIERLGASISASASEDFTVVSASTLSLYSSEIFSLLAEVVARPTFPENELDLYRRNTVEHLKFQRSQPGFLASEQVSRMIYGNHPYSRIAPAAEDIDKLDRAGLQSFHSGRFGPNNASLIVVGDIDKDELLREVDEHFGSWPQAEAVDSLNEPPPTAGGRRMRVVDRPGSAQSNIVLANPGIRRDHPDYFPLLVMNQVLGAGASSRVFMNLREEKGYTYGAYTRLDMKRVAGDLEATAEVRTAVTADSLREFFFELNRIRDEKVSEVELADAKNFLTGVFPIRAETQEGLVGLIVSQELFGLPEDYLETYRDNVAVVSAEDVQRVANAYVLPDEMVIVIVGDGREIITQAAEFASEVTVFDSDGRPKPLEDYQPQSGAAPSDFSGEWSLMLDFQGQNVPVSLSIQQADGSVRGTLETVLGRGEITEGIVNGNVLSATATTEIQGQSVELQIRGALDSGNAISGTISAPIIPDSLNFSGTRPA
jgi:zinc protease